MPRESSNRATSSGMPKIDIYGRDKEKKMIVDKICNHDDDGVPRVYAIWGMGGVGKTTLAQLVYNDETVKKHFDLKCWVYVSSVFDVEQIIKKICGLEDKKLEGKKYFIIMDDVWIEDKVEDVTNWNNLYQKLTCGAKGSTVMVTTRNEITARLMTKNISEMQHEVAVLSEDESWSLFEMLAFPGRGVAENVSPELKRVAKEIVKKCKGLPLAVNALGITMLGKKREVNEWQLVNKNFMWEMQDKRVLPALRISYDNLLPHWKRCFAYCCVFSKGERMSKDLLIELWIANEFIPSQGNLSLYEHGEKILSCLVERSFFQDVVEEDGYKMHDLMHDLAQYEMRHDCAVIEPGKESITQDEVLHLSLSGKEFKFSEQNLEKLKSVRSMFVYRIDYTSNLSQIFNHVYLRVLYLNRIKSSTLPESICKLIHLRFLKISHSEIEVLPESIIYLLNLRVLILEWCEKFLELPKGLNYMRNLQRIDTGSSSLKHGIKELANLRRLAHFVVGKDDGAQIGELENLNLLEELKLSKLENVGDVRDLKRAKLKDKTNLKSLILDWSWDDERPETCDPVVLEGLEPNSGLQELKINRYMGTVLSRSWMIKLVNLTSIQFHHLKICEQLPPLGKLPSLKRIELREMGSLQCFHDDDNATSKDEILFPSLQELDIRGCSSLVSLPSNFPKLQSLTIGRCDKLCSLPDEIQSFKDLNQITIYDCEILSRRCDEGIGKDWPKISHIPHLNIKSLMGTCSFMSRLEIYGRDEDKKIIVDKICSQDIGDVDDLRFYAIWGMGGIGKTTLAQLVYNDETVVTHFDLMYWVYVSAVFDVKRIIKSICESEYGQLDAMQTCLQNKLCGKKFFIVMDGVCIKDKDMADWDELCKGLSCGAKGSTVLVTTRKKDTAKRVAKIRELQHKVEKLSEDDSWSLFKMLAFLGGREGENVRELELVGREIVEKCKGLPLVVKISGSLMSTKKTVDKWQHVNNNFMEKVQEYYEGYMNNRDED